VKLTFQYFIRGEGGERAILETLWGLSLETERENASYLNLRLEPCSDKAKALVCRVSSETWALSDSKRPK